MRGLAVVAASMAAALIGSVVVAQAATDPYTYGWIGYDEGSGQCGATPPTANFAIVNATGGRPFSANSCLALEVSAAGKDQVSFYFNTGYAGAYGRDVTAACSSAASSMGYSGKLAQAYAIGCSEAAYATSRALFPSAAWWLDVETANSWSSSNKAYNVATIQGAIDEAHSQTGGGPVGVYSSSSAWQVITGGGTVSSVDGSWVLSGQYVCGEAAFGGSQVWIVQTGTTAVNGVAFDTDTAC
ncbi:MAG: hypothetical protein ACYDA0_05770 [Candidatus Dormibacteraceae bacterium]